MKNYLISVAFLVLAVLGSGAAFSESNPYRQALEAVDYEVMTTVLEKKSIGSVELRGEASLAVEVQVQVKDFLPRAMEPWLMVNGKKTGYSIGVISVENDTTTLGFVVPEHNLMRDGSEIAIQMGDEQRTRTILNQPLKRSAIKPLDAETAKKHNFSIKLPD